MQGKRGRLALHIECAYIPTDSTILAMRGLRNDVLSLGKVVLLGDFNARVGKSRR